MYFYEIYENYSSGTERPSVEAATIYQNLRINFCVLPKTAMEKQLHFEGEDSMTFLSIFFHSQHSPCFVFSQDGRAFKWFGIWFLSPLKKSKWEFPTKGREENANNRRKPVIVAYVLSLFFLLCTSV